MAKMMKLYKVGTALMEKGEEVSNWSSHNVLAVDAIHAIKKARKFIRRHEYVESVDIIGHVDAC